MEHAKEKEKKKNIAYGQTNLHVQSGLHVHAHPHSQASKHSSKKGTKKDQSSKSNSIIKHDQIPGLYQIPLSASLQSLLSCRIGIDITDNERWIYIDKKLILNEIDLKKEKTVFYSIKADIEAYPEETILIGSYGNSEFIMCFSQNAKESCENWQIEEQKQLEKKLLRFTTLEIQQWFTLGSEEEINENMKVYVSQTNIFNTNVIRNVSIKKKLKLDFRLVENAKDGYVELVTRRYTFENLYRKRLDRAIQAACVRFPKSSQTDGPASQHRSTQYQYTYADVKQSKELIRKINVVFALHSGSLCDVISSNSYYNLYKNDYMDLPNQRTRYSIENPSLLLSMHDSTVCHSKMVNCVSWNSYTSGLIAVAYSRISPKYICQSAPLRREPEHTVFDKHVALLWSFTDSYRPILYLHAERDITAITFCPYDKNVIIGGCAGGQIIVWDITGRVHLNKKENTLHKEHLSAMIESHINWMKFPPNEKHVFPCVTSNIMNSHKSDVTAIQWIPPNYRMTKWGAFEELEENDDEHMQFITSASSDKCMLVWDLKPDTSATEFKKKKRHFRLSTRPTSLDEDKSYLIEMNQNFKPLFQLVVVDTETHRPFHVNYFNFKMGKYCYKALNPVSIHSVFDTTWFVRDPSREQFNLEQTFLATTEFGQLYRCTWEAHEYEQGLPINKQKVDTINFVNYHDGPVDYMQPNPFNTNLILTTGGRIFAIWDSSGIYKVPLLWRKCSLRYVMAIWSLQTPGAIIAAREDAKAELWDISEDSKEPLRLIKFTGNELMSVFIDMSNYHVLKQTCLTTAFNGTLSLYSTPMNLFASSLIDSKKNVDRIIVRRAQLIFWKNYAARQNNPIQENIEIGEKSQEEIPVIKTTEIELDKRSSTKHTIQTSPVNTWQNKEYERMYNVLIANKKINLDEIEKQRKPMETIMGSRELRMKKIELYLLNKEKLFQAHKSQICNNTTEMKKKTKMKVEFPKELVQLLKDQYYAEYTSTEKHALNYISSHRYRYYFDWEWMIEQAKERYINGEYEVGKPRKVSLNAQLYEALPKEMNRKATNLVFSEIPRINRRVSLSQKKNST